MGCAGSKDKGERADSTKVDTTKPNSESKVDESKTKKGETASSGRDIKSGKIGAVTGASYMLRPNEELRKKELPVTVEQLLFKDKTDEGQLQLPKEKNPTLLLTELLTILLYKSMITRRSNLVLFLDLTLLCLDLMNISLSSACLEANPRSPTRSNLWPFCLAPTL